MANWNWSIRGRSQGKGWREDINLRLIRKVSWDIQIQILEFEQIQEIPKIIEPENVVEMPKKSNLQIEVPEITFSDEEEEKWVH